MKMSEEEKRPRVLVVDDNPKVLKFVEIDLRLRGFHVDTAGTGEQALELAETIHPDVILLDIILPGISGFDVLRELRQTSRLPIIAFSASQSNRDEALRLGANDFVSKPFDPAELARRLRAVLSNGH